MDYDADAAGSGRADARDSELPGAPGGLLDGISAVWKDVLGLDVVDPQASFFDVGGDSIRGIQMMNRVQTLVGADLDKFAILDHDTPLELARYVGATLAAVPSPAPAAALQRAAPEPVAASPAQLSVWLASQFDGGLVAFNLSRSFRLTGTVDTDALQRALHALAARHDALRASFTLTDEKLMQWVVPEDQFSASLECVSIGGPPPGEPGLTEFVREFASRPFDLQKGPLLRAHLARFSENEHLLTVCTHHIVADGWSLKLMAHDLAAFYDAYAHGVPVSLRPLGTAYLEHCRQQEKQAEASHDADAAYWLARFETPPPVIELPLRAGTGGTAFSGSYRDYAIPGPLWLRLKEFARAEGGTAFVSVLSALAALISRYTEHGEMVLGTSVAGRGTESAEELVGMFVRTLPLRLSVGMSDSFRSLFGQVRSTLNGALHHLDYPYEELVQELRQRGVTSSPHLFSVLIEFEKFSESGESSGHAMASGELRVQALDVRLETSVFPLNVMLVERAGTLAAVIRFDTGLFDAHFIDQLWGEFTGLLEVALNRPMDPLARLPLLSEPEQLRIRTFGYRARALDASFGVHHAIEQFAARDPGRTCLSCGADERTYGQLNARANQLARFFTGQLQVTPGEVVALIMDRSVLMAESVVALWKCGAAYLPVDPGYPPSYMREMLRSARVRVAAIDPAQASPGTGADLGEGCLAAELTAETGSEESEANLDIATGESSLAYVIYTSGSTGVPKGVMVQHAGMLNHLHAKIADLSLSERAVVAQNASSSFDISVWQMFAAPFAGGRTVIYPEALQLHPVRFAERLAADKVTVLEVVPSYLETMLDAWEQPDHPVALRSLEFLVVTGEAALPRLVNRWLQRFPGVPVVNAYGPTEASDDVTHHVITELIEADLVPLGRPIPNTLIYVLDEHLRVCRPGERGEIFISGIGVSLGYLHAPDQTAQVFMPDPFEPERRMYRTGDLGRWTPEGILEYLGRADSQVKVRGFRIDLGEVERRVSACPGVKAAAVVISKNCANDEFIAFVVPEPGGTVSACHAQLSRELPHHMVPTVFAELSQLPLTASGKVDRKALRRLDVCSLRSAPVVSPRSESERVLTQIWEEVLGTQGIGVTDRFFDVGGNSLRAIEVLSRIRSRLGADLELEMLFSHPTIADLAASVPVAGSPALDPIPCIGGPGSYRVALTQQLLLQVEQTPQWRDAFNRNDLYALRGDVDTDLLRRSFELVLARHESLRTTFGTAAGTPVQIIHEAGVLALPFSVHDFSQDADPAGASRRFAERRIRTPFEISTGSLIRADLLQEGSGSHSLLVSMHQLVSDGRSAGVLLRDWLAFYQALMLGGDAGLPSLGFQYKDAARWRNERMTREREREHCEFWRHELAGSSTVIPLRTDWPRPPVPVLPGARLDVAFPADLTDRLAALSCRHRVTEFVAAWCAVGLLLLAETGQDDVTTGTYRRGRNRLDLQEQIGFYINAVPLRLRLLPDDDVRRLLVRAQRDVLRAFGHGDYPYEWIMRELGWHRGPDRSPLFDVMVAMDDLREEEGSDLAGPPVPQFEPQELPHRSKDADLLFAFRRSPECLSLALTYNTELFSLGRIEHLADRLQSIIEAMVEDRPLTGILAQEGTVV